MIPILVLTLWLQVSVSKLQHSSWSFMDEQGTTLMSCDNELHSGGELTPTNCKIEPGKSLDDLAKAWSLREQRDYAAANGYPLCRCNMGTGEITPKQCSVEPVDVPAVQVGTRLGNDCGPDVMCFEHQIPVYSCTDKSRVLLSSEDGKKHCIKF